MSDRAGFFAGLADVLTAMCIYYVAAGILIMNERGWGLHLFWLLLCAAVCAFVFAALLKKPRNTPLLTVVTGVLVLASLGVFLLASSTPPRFGYVFVLCIGAGMAAGLPLYYGIHRPQVMRHLNCLEFLILAVLGLMLAKTALGIDGATVALMIAVLLMDAAAAVGLRMSDGEQESEKDSAFKATLIALAGAGGLSLLIGLMTLIFSRSGDVTGRVLHGIGAFFAAIGRGVERVFQWFADLVYREQKFDAVELDTAPPSVAGAELAQEGMELSVNTTAVGIVLVLLVMAAAVAVAVILRRQKVSRREASVSIPGGAAVRRTGGGMDILRQRLCAALRFRWTAFVNRDTPGGVLLLLERVGRRMRQPRQTGETMRAFIRRMDSTGGLDELSAALDKEYYGGVSGTLSGKRCRELKRYIRRSVRKAVQHG